jgi:hypothetical protein
MRLHFKGCWLGFTHKKQQASDFKTSFLLSAISYQPSATTPIGMAFVRWEGAES